ncbi:MAG: type II CAAX endopeptidase family protein, partial [Anaerolineae bacterium]
QRLDIGPERKRFGSSWMPILFFLLLEVAVTMWGPIFSPLGRLPAAIGTMLASAVIGGIGWWFLRREGVKAADIGLTKSNLLRAVVLFIGWWVVVTIVDLVGSDIARLLGFQLSPIEQDAWSSPMTVINVVRAFIFVGFAEEIAFRGYLQNKLIVVTKRRWLGIVLAALLFGLWHAPADIVGSGQILSPLLSDGLFFSLIGIVLLGLPYEWTGLLPFVALFHGWNDNLLLITGHAPTWIGIVAGYALMFVAVWGYRRFASRRPKEKAQTSIDLERPAHHQAE